MSRSKKTLQATTWVLIASLGSQALASAPAAPAAPAPVPQIIEPANAKDALHDIDLAESILVEDYFRSGLTMKAVTRFESDFSHLAKANQVVGLADHLDLFAPWWASHEAAILSSRAEMKSKNLEGFFTEVLLVFEHDRLHAQKDPSSFMIWLTDRVTNPVVRQISGSAFSIFTTVLTFSTGIVYGAVVAGPVAGSVGAFLEPVVRPLREKVGVLGSRWLGGIGVKLNSALYKEKAEAAAAPAQEDLAQDLKNAKQSQIAARKLMRSMGLDMSPDQYAQNIEKMREIWNETNQSWSKIHPSIFKDGRNIVWEALYFRPQAFSAQVMQGLTAGEVFRQGIEHTTDRIISMKGADRVTVETAVKSYLAAVDRFHRSDMPNPDELSKEVAEQAEVLKSLGATETQIERLQGARLRELMFAKQTATTLASSVVHDFHFEEFNRSLPEVIAQSQKVFRAGFCLDYFTHEFNHEISNILKDLDFRVELMEKAAANSHAQSSTEPATLKKESDKVPAKEPKTTKLSMGKRALGALRRLNAIGTNRAVLTEREVETAKGAEPKLELARPRR